MPLVGVVIGSKTDEPLIQPTLDILNELGISYELSIISAHRTPEKTQEYGKTAHKRGLEVIIAAAGAAAALPGVLASWTVLPVIGIPLPTSELKGVEDRKSVV
jgi:5-(carboxyamino)imidazole ribonucleotide mutase